MDQDVKTLGDVVDIAKRRRKYLIWPAVGVFALAVMIAFVWPPTYRSTSTILIEEQEIPREYVMTTVSSYAEQRLQTINQRIMSTSRLMEIINRFNLYANKREKWTMEEIVDRMRKKDVKFELINADVIDRRTGRPTAATIAFSVAFEGADPSVVQQVANVLASLYLEENLRVREQQTEGATRFMEDERRAVEEQMAEIDRQITAFKQLNVNTLPELAPYNLQIVDRLDQDIDRFNNQLKELNEKENYLQSQLASIPQDSTNPDKDRLRELRVKLINLESRFTDEYPDVKKTKAEIADLERKLKGSAAASQDSRPDNPAYVTLAAQLASTRSEIESVRRQLSTAQERRNDYQRRIATSPRVEESYRSLMTRRNNLQAKYEDLTKKYMEAKVAYGLEKGQMGERFTLIDAAILPEKPVRPNILAIILIGFVLGIGAGVGTAALKEFGDQSFRSAEALSEAVALPVLGVIPEILTLQDMARIKKRTVVVTASVVCACLIGIVVFHFFIMDLDIFWAKLMRKMPM
ncbi:MAG TPA: chain-length determining protein [Syntrophales bacterium]|nr:chain-length determining protein [Syntrophales bacterium]